MTTLHIIALTVSLGIVAGLVGSALYQYKTTPGTSILTAFHNSATILWARIMMVLSALMSALVSIISSGDPNLEATLRGFLKPEYAAAVLFVFGLVVELARWRTLGKSPDA